jgi:cephalosporin hydroxylase
MLTIDEKNQIVEVNGEKLPLYSPQAFEAISALWVKMGWANKYSYQFSWMGRPIIQLPEDLLLVQEMIYQVKPSLIIETGIAHGGSLIFYASLFKAMGKGRVIGVDIEIREHNRSAIEAHELFPLITLVEGSSTAPAIVDKVHGLTKKDDVIMILLDSNHSYAHVLDELRAYAGMVSVGSYIVATDGIMKDLDGVPGAGSNWQQDNPQTAVFEFLKENKNFVLERPKGKFNQSQVNFENTYWPNAWLKRVK